MTLVSHVAGYIWPPSQKACYPFLSELAETGRPLNELVATVVGLAVGSSVNYAQGVLLPSSLWFTSPELISSCRTRHRLLPGREA